MRPPKRHITEIEALWESMTDAQQSRALEEGRQFLARAGEQAPRQRASASASRSTGASRASARELSELSELSEEREGSPWGLLAVGAIFLGGIGWLFWQGRGA